MNTKHYNTPITFKVRQDDLLSFSDTATLRCSGLFLVKPSHSVGCFESVLIFKSFYLLITNANLLRPYYIKDLQVKRLKFTG